MSQHAKKDLVYFNRHRLLYLRLTNELSQARMAEIGDMRRTNYQKHEYGDLKRMSLRRLHLYADYFVVDISYLLQSYPESQLKHLEDVSREVRRAEEEASANPERMYVFENKLKLLDAEIKLAQASIYSGADDMSKHKEKKEEKVVSKHLQQTIKDVLGDNSG